MIITLTLNPAVDQTSWVERLEPGRVHRVTDTHIDPAGNGINGSRMAHRQGWPTIAFGLLAGDTGNIVEKALHAEGVQHHFIRVPGQNRNNMTVVDRAGAATSFYGTGSAIPAGAQAELDALIGPPAVERRSTVGSGDAMVAGVAVALSRGADIIEALRLGTAAGAATAASEGTALGTAEEVARLLADVVVEALA